MDPMSLMDLILSDFDSGELYYFISNTNTTSSNSNTATVITVTDSVPCKPAAGPIQYQPSLS